MKWYQGMEHEIKSNNSQTHLSLFILGLPAQCSSRLLLLLPVTALHGHRSLQDQIKKQQNGC